MVFTLISVALCLIVTSGSNMYGIINGEVSLASNTTGIYMLSTVLSILCTVIPIIELAPLKNRRNLDTIYFLPMSKWKLALMHFLSGFAQITFIYTVAFGAVFAWLAINTDYYALGYMIPFYFLSLLLGLMMYSIIAFIFNAANTVVDGVIFIVLWTFLFVLLNYTVGLAAGFWLSRNISEVVTDNLRLHWLFVYSPINNLTVIYQDLIEINRASLNYNSTAIFAETYLKETYMFYIWGAFGIAAIVGYFVTFIKKGAEKAGDISTSIFGYKTLVPIYGYCLITMVGTIRSLFGIITSFLVAFLIASMVIGHVIYRRSFKLKLSDILICVGGIPFSIIVLLFA